MRVHTQSMMPNVRTPPPPADPPRRTAADRVRARRLELGLSQFQVAALAGIALTTYSLVERGGILTPATAEKVCGVLGLFPEELLP